MKLRIKNLKFSAGRPVCMIHEETAKEMSLHVGKRVLIKSKKDKEIVSIIDTIKGAISPKEIAVSEEIIQTLNLKNHQLVDVQLAERPNSINLIKKKLKGEKLNQQEIQEIIQNIANNSLTEVEVAFFVAAVYTKGMTLQEIKYLTEAMVKTGKQLKLRGKIADKHGTGGTAGNRTTPLVVSICSAAGLTIPKTSSRAITSAAGTADVIETIADVEFSLKEIKKIIKKTKACLVWGGALGLAPTDDKIIRIEKIARIDSPPQVLASILSKKISVDSKYVLIDIPFGKSAKVSKKQALKLKSAFLKIGKKFGLKIKVVLTDGSEPIGNGVGPVLELKDILKILKRKKQNSNYPIDLEQKSIFLSGKLLELAGKAKPGKGKNLAIKILNSGKAFKKFQKIIKAQHGDINNLEKIKKPKFSYTIKAKNNLKIKHFNNKLINKLARAAGCPEDKAAGVYLHKKKGDEVKKGGDILTIYSVSEEKLKHAVNFYNKHKEWVVVVG